MWLPIMFLLGLSFAISARAQAPTEQFNKEIVFHKPVCDAVLHPSQDKEDCFYKAPPPRIVPKTGYVRSFWPYCSCVMELNNYFKTSFRTTDALHRAISIPTKYSQPQESGFAITRESSNGHILHYYKLTLNDGTYKIIADWEFNYRPCAVSTGREVPLNMIKGYM